MSNAGEELNEIAVALEHQALALPRALAALVLTVAAARVVGEAPAGERQAAREKCEGAWRDVLAKYGLSAPVEAAEPAALRTALRGLVELTLEMGHTIRRLDAEGHHCEEWTNDGTPDVPADPGYVPDARFEAATAMLRCAQERAPHAR